MWERSLGGLVSEEPDHHDEVDAELPTMLMQLLKNLEMKYYELNAETTGRRISLQTLSIFLHDLFVSLDFASLPECPSLSQKMENIYIYLSYIWHGKNELEAASADDTYITVNNLWNRYEDVRETLLFQILLMEYVY